MSTAVRRSPQLRSILVGVRDVLAPPKQALAKAKVLANRLGARVELFHAVAGFRADEDARPIMEQIAAMRLTHLKKLARERSSGKLKVSAHVCWDTPSHEAIARRARGAERFGWFLAHTDWELLRTSMRPLLVAKSPSN